MFQLFQDPAASIADAIGVLLVAGVIITSARFPRRAVLALAGIAVALLGLFILGYVSLLALHPHLDSRLASIITTVDIGALSMSAAPALAAWVASLWRAAKTGQWGWFAAILIFPLITPLLEQLLYMTYVQTPGAGYGNASGQFICADVTDLCGFVPLAKQLPFIAVPLLTPLVTLVYGIAGPQEKPDVSASNTATDTAA